MPEIDGFTLKKIQLELGLKAKDFADELGVHPSYLSSMMSGSRPVSQQVVSKASERFRVGSDILFDLANKAKSQLN